MEHPLGIKRSREVPLLPEDIALLFQSQLDSLLAIKSKDDTLDRPKSFFKAARIRRQRLEQQLFESALHTIGEPDDFIQVVQEWSTMLRAFS